MRAILLNPVTVLTPHPLYVCNERTVKTPAPSNEFVKFGTILNEISKGNK